MQYKCYTIVRCTTHARICYSVLRANGFIEWNYNSIRDTIVWIKPSISCFLQLLFWLICFLVPLIMTTMNPSVPGRISTRDRQFIIRVIKTGTMLQSNKIKDEFRRKDLTIDQWMIFNGVLQRLSTFILIDLFPHSSWNDYNESLCPQENIRPRLSVHHQSDHNRNDVTVKQDKRWIKKKRFKNWPMNDFQLCGTKAFNFYFDWSVSSFLL